MSLSRFYARRIASNTGMSTLSAPLASAAVIAASVVLFGCPIQAGEGLPKAGPSGPHPAVARIIAPGRNSVSYGSGALVAVSQYHGLVVTNWHVIREAAGTIHVVFPGGFRSPATVLRADRDWDLAALAIWRPPVDPIPLSREPPQPGQWLWIAGYGQGSYRAAAGRCTQYYAPGANMPYEIVELSVAAREGDSGGPILNQRGELAGVLFGASWGTTMGSYCGRVERFLAATAGQFQRLAPPPVDFAQHNQHNASSQAALGGQSWNQSNPAGSGWVARQTAGVADRIDGSDWLLQRQSSGGSVAASPGSVVAGAARLGGNAGLSNELRRRQPESVGRYDAQIGGNSASPGAAHNQLHSADRATSPALLGGAGRADGRAEANVSAAPTPSASPTVEGQTSAAEKLGAVPAHQPPLETLKNILALVGALLLAYHALRLVGRSIG